MNDARLYYTPPEDKLFDEVKRVAMELWTKVDPDGNRYGYTTEKHNRIKDIGNIQDNFMYMVAMFDHHNQRMLADHLSPEARTAIRERMIDGGNPPSMIPF